MIAGNAVRDGRDDGKVRDMVEVAGVLARVAEVQSRCRRTLHALAEALDVPLPESYPESHHVDPVGTSV